MRVLPLILAFTCAPASTTPAPRPLRAAQYDIVIRGGDVIDGTGAARRRADVAIKGDSIAAIGDLSHATAKITIDASHQVVTPGFIDLLGHSEFSVLIDPRVEGKVRQGVTTEVTGEGHSPGPIDDKMAAEIDRTRLPGFPDATWRTLGDFMRMVEAKHSAINFAFFIGAANPREIVIGAALDEAFRIGREAHVPVNIFHLKVGGSMRGHMSDVIAKIESARKSGLDVASQIYPYTATSTDLTSVVPAWALDGGYLKFVERLKDPATRAKIASEIRVGDGSGILVRNLPRAPQPWLQYERKRLDAIAKAMNTTPAEAALRLFEVSNSSPIAIYFGLSEEDLQLAMKQPWVAVGSDSGAVVGAMKDVGAHPRAYGTFPRILGHYVRDVHLSPLEEAVRKMTSLAASRAGFKDRGGLKVGMKADVVVFDPATIRDVSTYEDPHHFSEGISCVIVNGTAVLLSGKMTGALPGRVLRRSP